MTHENPYAEPGRAHGSVLLSIFFFVMLSLSYTTNCFEIVEDGFYRLHSADPESLVVGRLIQTESYGLTSKTGFLVHSGYTETFKLFRLGARPISMTDSYVGQAGLQGWILSLIDLGLYEINVSPPERLAVLRILVACALSAVLSLWIYFLSEEFGTLAAMTGGLMIFYSPWLTMFADNLYWVPVTWFIPMILSWHYAVRRPELLKNAPWKFYVLSFVAVAAKALCGFEYITAVVAGSGAALLYGLCKREWDRADLVRLVGFGIACVAAAIFAFVIQFLLLSVESGSFSFALGDFVHRVQTRSVGGYIAGPEVMASYDVSIRQILETYLFSVQAINIPGVRTFTAIEILAIFAAPLGISLLYLAQVDARARRLVLSILVLFLSSLAASVSWHVIARGHSFIHTFLNYVLWFVPLFIVLPALSIGSFSKAFLLRASGPTAVVAGLVMTLIWAGYSSRTIASFASREGITLAAGIFTVRVEDGRVRASFPCDKFNLSQPFFVRLHSNPEFVPNESKATGAVETVFSFRDRAATQELNELRYGKCAFNIPSFIPLDHVSIGQTSGSLPGWTMDFEPALKPALPQAIVILDHTDLTWKRGMRRASPGRLIQNSVHNRQALLYASRMCAEGQCARIQEITFDPDFISLTLAKEINESGRVLVE